VEQPPARSPSQSATVWMCYGAMMCLAIAVNLTPVCLTTFGEAFGGEAGLSEEQLGRIPGLTFFSLTLAVILCGPLADRFGGKLFSILGLALVAGGVALVAAAQSYGMLLGAACLMGFGTGMLDMILSPIVSAMQPERRASAMNWLHSFYSIGAVCSVLFGTYALLKLPWRMVWGIMALLPAAVLVGFALVKVPPLVDEGQQRQPVRKLATFPYFILAVISIFLIGGTEHGVVQWLPAFAERSLKLSKFAGGNIFLGYLVVMVLARMLVASVGRHIKPIRHMGLCTVM
jgi:fucose permease